MALLLVYASIWLVAWRYWGLQHDALAYSVQALSRIDGSVLGQDLFLRFQSQNDYTLFPGLVAVVIQWVGLEPAAAAVTFCLHAGWLLVAFLLARQLVGAQRGLLALGCLLAIPGWYGAGTVFRTAEPFLSARPAAELACLLAILLMVHGRRMAAVACIGFGLLMHPIMAFPGALLVAGLLVPWQDRRHFWPALAAGYGVIALAGASIVGAPDPLMSGDWLEATRTRSAYLFPQTWSPADWQLNLLPLSSAIIAARFLEGWSQKLARSTFWLGACGLALAIVSATQLPLQLILQGQPWRWIWPACVIAILLLPATIAAAWTSGDKGRMTALLMATAWMLAPWSSTDQLPPVGGSACLIMIASLIAHIRIDFKPRTTRFLLFGASAGTALATVALMLWVLAVLKGRFDFGTDPLWVQSVADLLAVPAIGAFFAVVAWQLAIRRPSAAGIASVAIIGLATLIAAGPGASAAWLTQSYGANERAEFAAWRARVPRDAEVLWIEGLGAVWYLMDRRSYLSVSQLAGVVFSDELVNEALHRARVLAPLVPPGFWFLRTSVIENPPRKLTRQRLERICVPGGPDFVADDEDVGNAVATAEWPLKAMHQYLYDCREIARLAATRPSSNPAVRK